jgi:hypothetical protein
MVSLEQVSNFILLQEEKMGIKILKSAKRVFCYLPFPKEAPDVKIWYNRLDDKKVREMRSLYGQNVMNKATGKMEFEITDEEGFNKMMLDEILNTGKDAEGFYTDEKPPVRITDIQEVYPFIKGEPWLLGDLVTRAFGTTPDGTLENLLMAKQVEEESKNS